ncbi:MAG TPA: hypothetical protein VJB69_01525 [Candidatus Paceibacterota bacterium]
MVGASCLPQSVRFTEAFLKGKVLSDDDPSVIRLLSEVSEVDLCVFLPPDVILEGCVHVSPFLLAALYATAHNHRVVGAAKLLATLGELAEHFPELTSLNSKL